MYIHWFSQKAEWTMRRIGMKLTGKVIWIHKMIHSLNIDIHEYINIAISSQKWIPACIEQEC
jgi:hypothetical protein